MYELVEDIIATLIKKDHDYGSGNIHQFGERGVLVRATDKINRLYNLLWTGEEEEVNDEAVDDTWKDLAGYAIIGYMERHGKWCVENIGNPIIEKCRYCKKKTSGKYNRKMNLVELVCASCEKVVATFEWDDLIQLPKIQSKECESCSPKSTSQDQ